MALARPAILPRLLTADEAAQYLGGITTRAVKRLRIGLVLLGAEVRYDRHALDAHLDALAGLASPVARDEAASPPRANDDDPEAAFERSAPHF